MNSATIKAWAKKPSNKERAVALGKRLFDNQNNPENLRSLDSLGEFEDRATEWAINNPMKAKALILSLLPTLLK